MNARMMFRVLLVLAVLCAVGGQQSSQAVTLVADPFISSYEGWVDPFPERNGQWRIHLGFDTLMETSDAIPAGGSTSAAANNNNGNFVPTMMIQDNFTTPSTYDLDARMYTSDDDGLGLVFGMQPNGDYFRVSMRQQTGGSFGHPEGLTIQKVLAGVVTRVNPAAQVAGPAAVTQAMIDTRTAFDLKVAVDGNDYEVFFNGGSLASGTDTDLAAGKVGVYSWAQRNDSTTITPYYGTELETISVSDNTGTLYSGGFGNLPIPFRHMVMTNSAGTSTATSGASQNVGNFGMDFRNGWVHERTNGFVYATESTPNTDFIGPATVVDSPGATSMSDYRFQVRMGGTDNDGLGVLVRAQDDDNFYRVNFATEGLSVPSGDGNGIWSRAPAGMSIQKVRNGVWSTLFSEVQGSEKFLPDASAAQGVTPATGLPMFDLIVHVAGNRISVRVIDQDGVLHVYNPVFDNDNPLLTGSVGFTHWGDDQTYWMPYRGVSNPLVTAIPEPSTIALALLAGLSLIGWVRRKK